MKTADKIFFWYLLVVAALCFALAAFYHKWAFAGLGAMYIGISGGLIIIVAFEKSRKA